MRPLGGLLRKGAGRHPHVVCQLFTDETEMDSEVIFRADDMPDLAPPISYRLVGHSRANRAIGMMQEILPLAPTPVTTCWSHEGKECGIVIRGQGGSHRGRAGSPAGTGDGYYLTAAPPPVFTTWGSGVRADLGQHARQLLTGLLQEQPAGIPPARPGDRASDTGSPPAARPRHHRPGRPVCPAVGPGCSGSVFNELLQDGFTSGRMCLVY